MGVLIRAVSDTTTIEFQPPDATSPSPPWEHSCFERGALPNWNLLKFPRRFTARHEEHGITSHAFI